MTDHLDPYIDALAEALQAETDAEAGERKVAAMANVCEFASDLVTAARSGGAVAEPKPDPAAVLADQMEAVRENERQAWAFVDSGVRIGSAGPSSSLQAFLIAAIKGTLSERGMTQKHLAIAAGFSEKHITQMLRGHVMGTLDAWQRMADALNIDWPSPSAAVPVTDEQPQPDEITALLRDIYWRTPETADWLDINDRIADVLRGTTFFTDASRPASLAAASLAKAEALIASEVGSGGAVAEPGLPLSVIQARIGQHARESWPNLTVPVEGLALAEEALELIEVLARHLGAVCRAIVKADHGNRGTPEQWDAELQKELADLVLVACNLATLKRFQLGPVVEARLVHVVGRDLDHDPVQPDA